MSDPAGSGKNTPSTNLYPSSMIEREDTNRAPIRSTLSGNTDMAELIEWFVGHLGERASELQDAWTSGDLERLRVIAHQMKGSSAGYGFETLGRAAARLESAAIESDGPNADLEAIRASFESLIDLCSRATT